MAKIFSALMTPFNEDQSINEKGLEQSIEYQIKNGVDGFYVTGSTAECFMMSPDERKRILKSVAEIVDARVDLIAHVGAISQYQATDMAIAANEYGYKKISSVVPFYFDFTFDNIVKYFDEVSKDSGLPIFVYNIPATTSRSFSLDQLFKFLESDRVCGIKHTSMDFFQLERMKKEFPNKTFMNGRDECFLSGLVVGADGMIGSTANIVPYIYKKIANAYDSGDLIAAREYQDVANKIISLLQTMEFNIGMKHILKHYGVEAGGGRKPFGELRECDKELIEKNIIPLMESVK